MAVSSAAGKAYQYYKDGDTLFRAYKIKETQWGTAIDGPNGHRWMCKPDDAPARITALAKALDRAYLEGQVALVHDEDIRQALLALETVGTVGRSPDQVQDVVDRFAREIQRANRKLANISERNRDKKVVRDALEEPDPRPNG